MQQHGQELCSTTEHLSHQLGSYARYSTERVVYITLHVESALGTCSPIATVRINPMLAGVRSWCCLKYLLGTKYTSEKDANAKKKGQIVCTRVLGKLKWGIELVTNIELVSWGAIYQ